MVNVLPVLASCKSNAVCGRVSKRVGTPSQVEEVEVRLRVSD